MGDHIGPGLWIRVQHRFGPRMMEWFCAAVTTTFGIVLLINRSLFAQPTWAGFDGLIRSQSVFGWIMISLGLLRLAGLVVNGARKHVTPMIRQVSAVCGFLIWVGIVYGFASSEVLSTWAAVYPWLAAAELTNIYRAAHDQGEIRGRDYQKPAG